MTDSVAIYLPTEPPTIESLARLPGVKDAIITCGREPYPQQYRVTFLDTVLITINVMPDSETPAHLKGFSNYVMSQHIKKQNEATGSVLERIAATKTILGCVIEPGFDKEGFVGGLLTSITAQYFGLMFARDCVFDSDGTYLMKPVTQPA